MKLLEKIFLFFVLLGVTQNNYANVELTQDNVVYCNEKEISPYDFLVPAPSTPDPNIDAEVYLSGYSYEWIITTPTGVLNGSGADYTFPISDFSYDDQVGIKVIANKIGSNGGQCSHTTTLKLTALDTPFGHPLPISVDLKDDLCFFRVYVPTYYGGNMMIDWTGGGMLSELTKPDGTSITGTWTTNHTEELGLNTHGWYSFKLYGATNAIELYPKFKQEFNLVDFGAPGPDDDRFPWNFWYWPTNEASPNMWQYPAQNLSSDDPNLVHSPLYKYDLYEVNNHCDYNLSTTNSARSYEHWITNPFEYFIDNDNDCVYDNGEFHLDVHFICDVPYTCTPNSLTNEYCNNSWDNHYPETFTDVNQNCFYDAGDSYIDWNGNGQYDDNFNEYLEQEGSWWGHCYGASHMSSVLRQPEKDDAISIPISNDELEAMWAEIGEKNGNWNYLKDINQVNLGADPGFDNASQHPTNSDSDKYAKTFHSLVEYVSELNYFMVCDFEARPMNSFGDYQMPNKIQVWNHSIFAYDIYYYQDNIDNLKIVRVKNNIYANQDKFVLTDNAGSIDQSGHKVVQYQYIVEYATNGYINQMGYSNWLEALSPKDPQTTYYMEEIEALQNPNNPEDAGVLELVQTLIPGYFRVPIGLINMDTETSILPSGFTKDEVIRDENDQIIMQTHISGINPLVNTETVSEIDKNN